MATAQLVAETLTYLEGCYPSSKLTSAQRERMLKSYAVALHDVDDQALWEAAVALSRRSTFMPSAGELYQEASGPDAAEAWGLVMAEMRRIASGGSPDNLPPAARAALEAAVGWDVLRMADAGETVAHRARFMDAYARQRPGRLALPPGVSDG